MRRPLWQFTKARRFKDGLLLFQGASAFNWPPDFAAADVMAVANAQELARWNIPDYRDVDSSGGRAVSMQLPAD
ncbi:hypothetical protein [Polaromonas sp. YR568]|uniref:hypothetical protein n=1 Tax=Polaromonas sp. YR568 TaxID=1855301 RepID=UPI00398BE4B0